MKENMYNTVKKHDAEIDDLRKKVDKQETRIETIETRGLATAPETRAATIELPDNLATTDFIKEILDEKFESLSIEQILTKLFEKFPERISKAMAEGVAKLLEQKVELKVAEYMREGIKNEFAEERTQLRDIVSDLRYRTQSIIAGQWWRAIPRGVWMLFIGLIVALGLSIWGNVTLYDDNARLRKTEWLYRYERGLYSDPRKVLHRERLFMNGTYQEVDSLKDLIRTHEQQTQADTTFIYFYPTER